MLKKRLIGGILVLSMIALIVVLLLSPRPTRSMEQPAGERTADVRIIEVTTAPLREWSELPASVEPYIATEVPAEVEGRIDWIGPAEGEMIDRPGTPIVRIDERSFRAQLEEAQAAHDLSVKKCRRAEELHAQGVMSDEELDQCRTRVATDAAREEISKIQLEKATVRAPIAGVLNKLHFDVGEYVRAGDRVADIVVIDPAKILVKIPEKDISYVRLGEKAHVFFDFLGQGGFEGTISYISVVGDPATRTYEVEITVANPKHEILPSMIATVRILKREIPDAITVPLVSVIPRGDFAVVFVEEGGRARQRPVELGILDGGRIQIIDGIEPRDRLIVEGQRALADGDSVRVRELAEVR